MPRLADAKIAQASRPITAAPVTLLDASLVTAAGVGLAPSLAAIRGGLCCFEEHPIVRGPKATPFAVAAVEGLEWSAPGRERLLGLLQRQFEAPELSRWTRQGRAGVWLLAPIGRFGVQFLEPEFRVWAARQGWGVLGVREGGSIAASEVLQDASRRLLARTLDEVFILALDTALDPADLKRGLYSGLLRHAENTHGYVPGEGAVLLRLGGPSPRGIGRLLGSAAEAERDRGPGTAVRARAISTAASKALGILPPPAYVTGVYADLTGEPPRSQELSVLLSRIATRLSPEAPVHHVADTLGDLASAAALVLLTMAACPARPAQGGLHLVATWDRPARPSTRLPSDSGGRAVFLVEPSARPTVSVRPMPRRESGQ